MKKVIEVKPIDKIISKANLKIKITIWEIDPGANSALFTSLKMP
jgi:hypothetical protein